MIDLRITAFLAISAVLCTHPARTAPRARGYDREPQPETAAAREKRYREVAARRAQPVLVLCHRGAAAFAPENTLEAYAAALDYGADGCEVDLRRTTDGVLVLFHDDMLDHLTDGFGTVDRFSYEFLTSLKPRFVYGTASGRTTIPTFAALLTLARQRRMLLHLDVKEKGLDAAIARMLEQADAWDQVVGVNGTTAPDLAKDKRFQLIRYKGPGLFEGRKDMDPEAVRAQLARPGTGIMVDDPRVAARELGRPAYLPVALGRDLRPGTFGKILKNPEPGSSELLLSKPTDPFIRLIRESDLRSAGTQRLAALLQHPDLAARRTPDGTPGYDAERSYQIVRAAFGAQALGRAGKHSADLIRKLEFQVKNRSLHRDWMFHGLDGALAARAIGMLGVKESAPVLIEAFRRIDPELKRVVNPEFGNNPLAWTDFRTKMYILPALGELKCAASKQFLLEYIAMEEAQARELAPLMYEDATRSLLRQELTQAEIEGLLRSPHSAVRGTALQECVDLPTRTRNAALRNVAPWALQLPRAKGMTGRDVRRP